MEIDKSWIFGNFLERRVEVIIWTKISSKLVISLYTIFADCRACLPDIHVQTLKGIHFLKPLLKGVVWQKTEFDFVAHVLRTKPLIVEKWFAPKLSV